MESLNLHTYPVDIDNFRSCCIQIAAAYSSYDIDTTVYSKEENDATEILKNSPYQSLPILETNEGYLFDTVAATLAVSDENLKCASNPYQANLVIQFMQYCQNCIVPPVTTLGFHLLGIVKITKSVCEKSREDLKKSLTYLNEHLKHNTFLVGEKISVADIYVGCSLFLYFKFIANPRARLENRSVLRWFNTLVGQDNFMNIINDFDFCARSPDFTDCLDDVPKQQKQQKDQQQKPKQQKEKSAKKEKQEVQQEIPKQKEKSPLDDLPATTISCDDLRQKYFALPRQEFIKYMFDNLEDGKWSFYHALYLDDHKLKEIYKSSNLINGMFSRIESIRKYTFGMVYLHGVDSNSAIHCLWLFRGDKNLFEVMDLDDIICYDFKRVDHVKNKKEIEDCLSELDYKNLKINKSMMLR